MTDKKAKMVSVRVPVELSDQLEELAGKLDRSLSWVARQALIVYLKDLKERDAAAS